MDRALTIGGTKDTRVPFTLAITFIKVQITMLFTRTMNHTITNVNKLSTCTGTLTYYGSLMLIIVGACPHLHPPILQEDQVQVVAKLMIR